MTRRSSLRSAAALAVCVLASAPAVRAASPPAPGATFATEPGRPSSGPGPAGAAAVVDGHAIPLKEVTARCLRDERSYVVDRMVQNYVVDRECKRRGIVVSDAEIDRDVEKLRKAVAPATLEQVIARHHSTMAYVREAFRQKSERTRLVEDQVKPEKMVHCRAVVIRFSPSGMPESLSGTKRSQEEALALANGLLERIQKGQDFAGVADRYSEASPKTVQGDYGILYDGMRETDPWIVRSALTLGRGGVFPAAIKSGNSYVLLQGVSTSDDHPADENAAYADALRLFREQQAQFLAPRLVVDLIKRSHRTYCLDPDRLILSGKPLPAAAAVIDGHAIPMKDVVAQCLAEDGPHVVDILVQNYLVDRECKRRGITVSPAQIDARVENLRRMIAPHTLAEGLASRHMTMDELRYDFKQDIERTRLVADRIKPAKMVHCRVIAVRYAPPGQLQAASATQPVGQPSPAGNATGGPLRSEADARALIADIQAQLKQGKDFGDLAARYSEMTSPDVKGDLGVFYPGMRDMDTALLDAGLALGKGETTPRLVKMADGYGLVQAVSTSGDHPASEDALYSQARAVYTTQQASPLIPQAIVGLIHKAKVDYYIHA